MIYNKMKIYNSIKFISISAMVLTLAACSGPTKTGPGASIDSDETDVVSKELMPGDDGTAVEQTRVDSPDKLNWAKFEPIHFDFDSATIREADRKTLEAIASYLKENPSQKILVAGNCDERGTTEYNLALGQRRASAARNYLVKLGAPADHVGTVSWGEEKPANSGHNEAAWSENRRDEFGIGE